MTIFLGDRMKSYYEDRFRFYLLRRTPVIVRLNGRAFHSLTSGCESLLTKDCLRRWQIQPLRS